MNKLSQSIILLIGAGLTACSSYIVKESKVQLIPIQSGELVEQMLETIIQPYRDTMKMEMGLTVATADTNFIAERPCGNLNNWAADAVLTNQTKTVRLSIPYMCLLNTGGLRTSFNKGAITLGDLFKIMPFDNTIVWVTMPIESLPEIAAYLQKTGGEPISNAYFENGELHLNGITKDTKEFIIITSDYLANGGDKMYFFEKAISKNETGILMRNAIIEEAKNQGTLYSDPTNRIKF